MNRIQSNIFFESVIKLQFHKVQKIYVKAASNIKLIENKPPNSEYLNSKYNLENFKSQTKKRPPNV